MSIFTERDDDRMDKSQARNSIERRDELIEELVDTIQWCQPKIHQAYHTGEIKDCARSVCAEFSRLEKVLHEQF